jgi:N-acetyl-1-D-myo-inositol-2-amino-2-deoxy-alpha-D-glucopyranoside deacetylase
MQNTPSPATAEAATEPEIEPLGAGATALSSVFGLLVGIVVGVITTFTHALLAPWGLIAGLAIVAALVGGFRLVFGSRVVGAAAAVGVIGASAVLALPGAGGTVLALDGPLGYFWTFGPAVISVIVLVLPALFTRRVTA